MSERAPDGTAYALAGPDDAPPVVLIHGLGLCREVWDGLMPAFAARHRVVAYDLYGHGSSGPAPQTASLALYAQQVAGLMNHLAIRRAALVGFSIGGMINRRAALDHPERVAALAILNAPHERGLEAQAALEARARAARDEGPMASMDAALERWFTPAFRTANPTTMARVRAWRAGMAAAGYADAAWVLAHGVRELIAPDPPVAAPTLVMTAAEDVGSTPAMSRAIAAEIAGAQTQIVPGLRHLGLMEKPSAFAEPVLRFLAALPR